jgi:hypothetical protein
VRKGRGGESSFGQRKRRPGSMHPHKSRADPGPSPVTPARRRILAAPWWRRAHKKVRRNPDATRQRGGLPRYHRRAGPSCPGPPVNLSYATRGRHSRQVWSAGCWTTAVPVFPTATPPRSRTRTACIHRDPDKSLTCEFRKWFYRAKLKALP